MNRFVFIIPFRNVRPYIKDCYQSLLSQNNKNWIAVFCDDESLDGTIDEIINDNYFKQSQDKIFIRRNSKRITALPNIHNAIVESNLNDEDIICILDGDDFLIRNDSIDILNNLYNDNTLLTYGQYIWPNGSIGHCVPYTKENFKDVRNGNYVASHIRTFKYKLYKELVNQDPNLDCYKDRNDNYYTITYDIAIMTPLMEIAGFENIKFNPLPVYYYRIHPQNDHFMDPGLQKSVANEIFAKKPFKRIF